MRQLGTLATESDARRLAAWLVTQRIDAHAESAGDAWSVWVRDEDHLPEARAALAHFQANPTDQRYRGAESEAERVRREDERERKKALGNIVEMRGRWGSGFPGAARRCPLVLGLIAISILVALASNTLLGGKPRESVLSMILFVDPVDSVQDGQIDMFASIRRGQVWRLVTPAFIHFDLLHIVFNMFLMYSLGGQIENRKGTWYMLLLVLALAVLCNLGEAIESNIRQQRADFGGMSGVGYGVFGYMLIKVRFGNVDHYMLSPTTVFLGIAWFVLCLARSFPETSGWLGFIPPIANSTHTVGLFAGMAIAYAPLLFPRRAP